MYSMPRRAAICRNDFWQNVRSWTAWQCDSHDRVLSDVLLRRQGDTSEVRGVAMIDSYQSPFEAQTDFISVRAMLRCFDWRCWKMKCMLQFLPAHAPTPHPYQLINVKLTFYLWALLYLYGASPRDFRVFCIIGWWSQLSVSESAPRRIRFSEVAFWVLQGVQSVWMTGDQVHFWLGLLQIGLDQFVCLCRARRIAILQQDRSSEFHAG